MTTPLTSQQANTLQQIVNHGQTHGFTKEQIQYAVDFAYLESRLGANTGTPGPTPGNPHPTAAGLYQYTDDTWDRHQNTIGDKNNTDHQIQAIYTDIQAFTNRYNNLITNGSSVPSEVTLEQYIYVKFHDGANATNFSNTAPGNQVFNSQLTPDAKTDLDVAPFLCDPENPYDPNSPNNPYNPGHPLDNSPPGDGGTGNPPGDSGDQFNPGDTPPGGGDLEPGSGLLDVLPSWPTPGFDPTHDPFLDHLRDLFDTGKKTAPDPLVLDLNGDGVKTVGLASGVYFDHDGNGFAELSGWASPDDGLLVWDRNGNGQIDNGSELFGNNTILSNGKQAANGFAALADLDANKDGKIDSNDAVFADLRVWRDLNGDGQIEAGELFTLNDLGIASLNTGYKTQNITDANGNQDLQVGSFTYANGTTGKMDDIWFTEDTTRAADLNRKQK